MDPENDDAGTGLADETGETSLQEAGAADDEGAAPSLESANDSGAEDTGAAAGEGDGPKSLAEALSAGIDSLKPKADEKADKAGGDGKDGKGDAAEKGADKKDAAAGKDKPGEKDAEGKDAKDGKKPDHVNDPIPAGVAERTKERITFLANEVKQLREVAENNGAMIGAIMDTGATPDEFGAMVGYLHAVHSDNPEQLEKAYTLLQSELQGLALRMGKPIPEVDWLSSHPDLVDALKAGMITRELAIETAMNRTSKTRATAQAAAKANKTKADTDGAAQLEKDTKDATNALDALGETLSKADPQYAAKYAILVPKLRPILAKTHPSQWKAKFLEEYAVTRVGAPAATTVKVNPPKNQPLRPSAPSGGQQKAAGSALDALSSAIDGMRG